MHDGVLQDAPPDGPASAGPAPARRVPEQERRVAAAGRARGNHHEAIADRRRGGDAAAARDRPPERLARSPGGAGAAGRIEHGQSAEELRRLGSAVGDVEQPIGLDRAGLVGGVGAEVRLERGPQRRLQGGRRERLLGQVVAEVEGVMLELRPVVRQRAGHHQLTAGQAAGVHAAGRSPAAVAARPAGDDIVTAAVADLVVTAAAFQAIVSLAAREGVISAAAGNPVPSGSAEDRVVARAAVDHVIAVTAEDDVIAAVSIYDVVTAQPNDAI